MSDDWLTHAQAADQLNLTVEGVRLAKTTQTIAAFEQLVQQLEAMVEARRPWWRRLRLTG